MSPILNLQQRLVEVGRLRMGASERTAKGAKKPVRLDAWRLTSTDEQRLVAAAAVYGGEVVAWEGRDGLFDLRTEAAALPILLMPGQTLSQWYEMWSASGCVRRCDGREDYIAGAPCQCPPYDERAELAAEGKACKPTTRLSVLLPDVPGIGCWRLETHGYYAAVELTGTSQVLEEVTRRGVLVPARLRIEFRTIVRNDQTRRFPVPVLDVDARAPDVMRVLGGPDPLLELDRAPAYVPVPRPELPSASVADQVAAMQAPAEPARQRKRAAAPVGDPPAAPAPKPEAVPVALEGEDTGAAEWMISDGQRRLLFATAGERKLPEDRLRQIIREHTGQESTRVIPARLFGQVLTAVRGAGEDPGPVPLPAPEPSPPPADVTAPQSADVLLPDPSAELTAELLGLAEECGVDVPSFTADIAAHKAGHTIEEHCAYLAALLASARQVAASMRELAGQETLPLEPEYSFAERAAAAQAKKGRAEG